MQIYDLTIYSSKSGSVLFHYLKNLYDLAYHANSITATGKLIVYCVWLSPEWLVLNVSKLDPMVKINEETLGHMISLNIQKRMNAIGILKQLKL